VKRNVPKEATQAVRRPHSLRGCWARALKGFPPSSLPFNFPLLASPGKSYVALRGLWREASLLAPLAPLSLLSCPGNNTIPCGRAVTIAHSAAPIAADNIKMLVLVALALLTATAAAQQHQSRPEQHYPVCGEQVVTLLADKNTIPWFPKELFIPAEGEDAAEEDGVPRSITCTIHGRHSCV